MCGGAIKGLKGASAIAILITIALAVAIFYFQIQNTTAAPLVEKAKLSDTKVQLKDFSGKQLLDLELLENTDQCLVDCYAIIKLHPYEDINLPKIANSEYKWEFLKASQEMPGLSSYSFEILENQTFSRPEYATSKSTFYFQKSNSTIPYGCTDINFTSYSCETKTIEKSGDKFYNYRGREYCAAR